MIFNETDTGFFGERLWLEKCTNALRNLKSLATKCLSMIRSCVGLKCGKPAKFLYFWRQWLSEVMRESSDPIYSNVGAKCCEECFSKIYGKNGRGTKNVFCKR